MTKADSVHSTPRKHASKTTCKHPDAKLIATCVEYGFVMGGAKFAYNIDPTDAEFAAPIDLKHLALGSELLTTAAKLKAETLDGLAAKARTALVLQDGRVLDAVGREELPFLKSLAEDVCRFHRLAQDAAKPFAQAGVAA